MRISWSRLFAIAGLSTLAACQPPATENSAERAPDLPQRKSPTAPIVSPDTAKAIWSRGGSSQRLVYGEPGKPPLLALECRTIDDAKRLAITRFISTDPDAAAIMVLIGNGHRARLPIVASWNGRAWVWQSDYPATLPDLDVFTGLRSVEATIPGAGTVVLNPSPSPRQLVEDCRTLRP